ncbi:hypothetical protein VCHA29O37_90121 [Vibrio chagasii]|nr:hypothetical protein VCHA29O37_90121 [Vibrio chagasii]
MITAFPLLLNKKTDALGIRFVWLITQAYVLESKYLTNN